MKLEEIGSRVEKDGESYRVIYEIGEYSDVCKYVSYKPMSKFNRGPILLMTECEMGDIIEYFYKNGGITSEDYTEVNMKIRFDSLYRLNRYIEEGK